MTRSTKTEVSDLPGRPSVRSRLALSAGRLTIRPLNGLLPNNQLGIWADQADQLVVAGDSAGGHLTLDLLLENHRQSRPQPAAAVMFSPLVDLDFRLARKHDRRTPEALASAKTGRRSVALYTRDVPAHSPRLRLAIPAGAALPPLFVQVSKDEMLLGDALHLRDMARAAGVPCDLEQWPGVMHVFQALPRLVPEADLALARAANFINSALVESNRKQVV